jgi:phosphoenolpyruvate phosphomutase
MEAHNGISAKIVEEAGFKGIWASGLTISASLGVRDSNEASWTQVLEVVEFMSEFTTVPILLDADTGYGNFNNLRRLIRKLEQRQVAGVCIEDKLFPKTNSFIDGETQPLADVDEFCGKIKAAKDTQLSSDFIVVARVEAFIAGWGLNEAIRRAEAYCKAGADAILIHSKKTNSSEIELFMREWSNRLPVVIVPTKYYSTPTDKFREMGVSVVIWANHNLRASVDAMQSVSKKIFNDASLINIENSVVSVAEIFRLQGAEELMEAEKRYLPTHGKNVNVIILAAAQGDRFGDLTKKVPKTLLKINGKSILSTQIDEFNRMGIKDITVVRGFGKEMIDVNNIRTVDNDLHADTKELYSLFLAKNEIRENTIICYGDIIFKSYILNELLNDDNEITIIADADYENNEEYHDYIKTHIPYSKRLFLQAVKLEKMSISLNGEDIDGEFIGLIKVGKKGAATLVGTLERMSETKGFSQMRIGDLFNEILRTHPVAVKFIRGSWLDINSIVDLQKAEEF